MTAPRPTVTTERTEIIEYSYWFDPPLTYVGPDHESTPNATMRPTTIYVHGVTATLNSTWDDTYVEWYVGYSQRRADGKMIGTRDYTYRGAPDPAEGHELPPEILECVEDAQERWRNR